MCEKVVYSEYKRTKSDILHIATCINVEFKRKKICAVLEFLRILFVTAVRELH